MTTMTREGFITGALAAAGLLVAPRPALPAPPVVPPLPGPGRVSDEEADADYAAYLATMPTEPQPLEPLRALTSAATHWEETLEQRAWVAALESYTLALWDHTQEYQTRDFELATEALRGKVPWRLIGDVDHAGCSMTFAALCFGARVGALVGSMPVPPIEGDEDQATWLARVYAQAEGLPVPSRSPAQLVRILEARCDQILAALRSDAARWPTNLVAVRPHLPAMLPDPGTVFAGAVLARFDLYVEEQLEGTDAARILPAFRAAAREDGTAAA